MRVLIKPRQLPLAWASAWLYQAPSSCSLSIISVPSRNKAVNKKVRNNGPGTGKNCENIDSIFGCYISISPISTCILLLLPSDDLSVDQLSMPASLRRHALVLPPSAGGPCCRPARLRARTAHRLVRTGASAGQNRCMRRVWTKNARHEASAQRWTTPRAVICRRCQ